MIVGTAYTTPALSPLDLAQAAECAELSREFQGWQIWWTTTWGYEARKDDRHVGPCTSRSALRCHLAWIEYVAAR